MSSDPSHLVANPIEHRLAQIGLHGPDVPGLEEVEPTQYMENRLLNQIARIERAPRCGRQLAVCPPLQLRHAPLQEGFDGLPITRSRTKNQLDRRFVADQRWLWRRIGRTWQRTHVMQTGCNDSGETRPFL
jgi:hypothetical protein